MSEANTATVFLLLQNYEEYGDEVFLHNGRIVLIAAGKKRGTAQTTNQGQCQNKNTTMQLLYTV